MNKEEYIYSMWAVMAVQGLMREADHLLRQERDIIYRVAGRLSRKFPKSLKVYRGILLHDHQITGNTVKEKWPVEFISFSESLEIACWFAAPDSFMSSYVIEQSPDIKSFIIELKYQPSEVLFHWSWHRHLEIEKSLNMINLNLIKNDWHTDLRQYLHNVSTQKEVILKPIKHDFELKPYSECCKISGPELDKKYLPPWIPRPT